MVFALNRHPDSTEKQIIYEVPDCIESALYLDEESKYVKGNITRFNTFKMRVKYFFKSYDYPKNRWKIERIERKIKKK